MLVVDDDPDERDLINSILTDCNAEVFTTGNADEALLLVERNSPDVLVSDIGMPDVDGFEFLGRIRALGLARSRNLPAIALTVFCPPGRQNTRTGCRLPGPCFKTG